MAACVPGHRGPVGGTGPAGDEEGCYESWCREGCVTRVGPRVAPLLAGDNGAPTVRGGVGQEGRKKSDKTMERNLNYAPRKMAIVCKAMLIQRSRKRGGAADFADADKLPLPRPPFFVPRVLFCHSRVPS